MRARIGFTRFAGVAFWGIAALLLFPFVSDADDSYPIRPLRVVVGYAPGGGSDRTTRTLQKFLEKEFGKDIVVENMAGAGGLIAQAALAREKPEGYMTTNVNYPAFAYGLIMQKTPFTFDTFTPMWIEVCDPVILVVKKDSKWNTLADFIEAVKSEPGKYAVSVAGLGGQHANALWLKKQLKLDFKIVTYNSGGESASALLGGHVNATFGDAVSRADMRSELKCLGVVSDKSNPIWPEGKPFFEQLKAYNLTLPVENFQARYGIYWVQTEFRKKYPDRYKKLVDAFTRATASPEYKALAEKSGIAPSLVNQEGTGMSGLNYGAVFAKEFEVIRTEIVPLFNAK